MLIYYDLTLQIWNHPDVLYHFLKRRNMGSEVVDLDLEETAGALVPLTPGGNPVAPVLPVKRGRGRSPKGTSPVKRERKVNPRKVRGDLIKYNVNSKLDSTKICDLKNESVI